MSITVYGAKPNKTMDMEVYRGVEAKEQNTNLQNHSILQANTASQVQLRLQVNDEGRFIGAATKIHSERSSDSVEQLNLQDKEALYKLLEGYKGKLYLTLYGQTPTAQEQVLSLYKEILGRESIHHNTSLQLELVYTPLDAKDTRFKQLPAIKALNINIATLEDRVLLNQLMKTYKKEYTIIISDQIATHYNQQLSEGLDTLSTFYYDLVLETVEEQQEQKLGAQAPLIFKVSDLTGLPKKYELFYNQLKENLQGVQYEKLLLEQNKEQKASLIAHFADEKVQLLVRPNDPNRPIEYVEYKVNDAPAGQSFRYPYIQDLDRSFFHKGINVVKVIAKVRGKDEYGITQFYVSSTIAPPVKARSSRSQKTYPLGQKPSYKKPYIPVLMYHEIEDQVDSTKAAQSICVGTSLFEAQLKTLLEAGYTPIHFKHLQDYLEGKGGLPSKPFIVTADDGYLDNYTKAYPILKKYQVPATFFVTSRYVGVTSQHEHFTWAQALEMEQSGLIDIQSHTHRHTLMNRLNQVEVDYEVEKSFAEIEKHLGKRDVKVLAYPQFRHTKQVKQWVEACGVDLQVTNLAGPLRKNANKTAALDIKRIHVSNDMSSAELLKTINKLTQ